MSSNVELHPRRIRFDLPHVGHNRAERASSYPVVKRAADLILSIFIMILSLPFLLVGCLLVKLTSRGPIFYSQVRLGKDGKPFWLYKLRTMRHNCEKETGPRWTTPGDSRVTVVGRFLRRTHIDELPQLWNVVRGDMALVGPRPERPEFIRQLEQIIPRYNERLSVRPGVTGLAQVQLPPDTDMEDVRRKLAYDIFYIEHVGLWLDLRLIVSTVSHMVGVPFRLIRMIFRLPRYRHVLAAYGAALKSNKRTPKVQTA